MRNSLEMGVVQSLESIYITKEKETPWKLTETTIFKSLAYKIDR